MKVLHINTDIESGAALCARRINCSLVKNGVESRMLFARGGNFPEEFDGEIATKDKSLWYTNFITTKAKHLLNRLPFYYDADKLTNKFDLIREDLPKSLFVSHPLSNFKNISHHPLVEWADIIHLHWISNFVDYPTFFRNVKKPIVWTMHDMNPAIGVMHYESTYTIRPKELDELDSLCRKIKAESLQKTNGIHIVAISEMMQEIIQSSETLCKFPITLIRNGVDTECFKPTVVSNSPVSYFLEKLKAGTKVFLFSSYNIWDRRKGLDRILKALEIVRTKTDREIALIIIGGKKEAADEPFANFPLYCTGFVKDHKELASIYSSVDFFINASYEEAFAQTPLEAMACGTPVISTCVSGSTDLINSSNGVISDGVDSESLAKSIINCLDKSYNRKNIRQYIINNYDSNIIAQKYIDLYNRVLI